MKALLIQSLILLMTVVAHGYQPEDFEDSHDITLDGSALIAITAKQRNMRVEKDEPGRHLDREEAERDIIERRAHRFCLKHKYARVAEDAAGNLIYQVGKIQPHEFKAGMKVVAWTADGVLPVTPEQVTKWKTRNNDGETEFEAFGPALVFKRLRCADRIQ
ncbi:MAG TPA: hypothetical protein VFV50_08240 [Bdellovibrionales bacterium]|nr:hypothetical protein [Bdellovibrionales bacterium]